MKRDFTNENFEDFLKNSADSLRMKAPDKVWQNLSKELNKRRRRFTIGLGAFLLISSAVGYGVIGNLPEKSIASESPQTPTGKETVSNETNKQTQNSKTPDQTSTPVISLQTARNRTTQGQQPATSARVVSFHNGGTSSNEPVGNVPNEFTKTQNEFSPTIVDSYTDFDGQKTTNNETTPSANLEKSVLPYTIESVINSFKTKNRKTKFETQLYFTPTISYRKLTENKSYLRSLDPAAAPSSFPGLNSSVNNNVTHKPDVGFELGLTGKYAVSNRLKIRGGVQFNVNRYDVKAFSSPLSMTTIALNNGGGIDSISAISGYSNVQGYKSNWLQNLSFQLSVPIGAEFTISENDDVAFGIATTIQPTYVLGDRAYLITTDYKNYMQVPWLIRRWNVNTALETFVTLKSGKTKWQIGPQVRYQLLSSFISEYPVKENLFDFGLKVGITLNNNR